MIIKACQFKRTKDSTWETGISWEINGVSDNARQSELILTEEGFVQGTLWEIKDCLVDLCIDVTGILNRIKL